MHVNPPDVSVIIRAHDPGRSAELQRAIDSVCAQSFGGQIEIVLETANFPIPPAVSLPEHGNVAINHRNSTFSGDSRTFLLRRGIRRAQAPLMMFLDSDDFLYPDAIRILHAKMPKDGSVLIANVDVTDGTADRKPFPYHASTPSFADILIRNSIPIHSYMMRTSVAHEVVDKIPNLTMYEDYAFLLHALSMGHPTFIQPFISVAIYHISPNMTKKYESVRGLSDAVISKIKENLAFPIQASDLGIQHSDILAQLVSNLPQRHIETNIGLVETCTFANGMVIIEGWCAKPGPIFAQDYEGKIHFINQRHNRSDVNAALGRDAGLSGFSGVLQTTNRIDHIFVVAENIRGSLQLV